jgi:hypothetical protein
MKFYLHFVHILKESFQLWSKIEEYEYFSVVKYLTTFIDFQGHFHCYGLSRVVITHNI